VIVGVARGLPPADEVAGCVDVLVADRDGSGDAVVPADGLDQGVRRLLDAIERSPIAATALAMLLRGNDRRRQADAFASESLVYSILQAGPEFRDRLAAIRRPTSEPDDGAAIRVDRDGGELEITLARPHVHNAFNRTMRDELIEALTLALADSTIETVVLRAEGPSFCSGGDLSEFGTLPDPATAHLVRMTRNVGRLLAVLHERLQVRLHGACIGAGIELAAFGDRVTAAPDTHVALPELSFGLIPGAGGTVSIPARIGRRRTAWLALTGASLDAATAREWGLVDEVA
jgi:enoyl-CoA hydratase/carnithine racemase